MAVHTHRLERKVHLTCNTTKGGPMSKSEELSLILRSLRFSASKHKDQRRKDKESSPFWRPRCRPTRAAGDSRRRVMRVDSKTDWVRSPSRSLVDSLTFNSVWM